MPNSVKESFEPLMVAALEYCYVCSVLCMTIIVEILKLLIHHNLQCNLSVSRHMKNVIFCIMENTCTTLITAGNLQSFCLRKQTNCRINNDFVVSCSQVF